MLKLETCCNIFSYFLWSIQRGCYNCKGYILMRHRFIGVLWIVPVVLFFNFFLLSAIHSESDQVDTVIQNLNSEYRDLRMSAVWTLRKVKDPRALEALIKALKHEDLHVRE